MALRSTSLSSPIVPNCLRSSSGCGTDDCGRTSGPSRPSTMPPPPSTRPSGARGRRSVVFVREDGETATESALLVGHHHRLDPAALRSHPPTAQRLDREDNREPTGHSEDIQIPDEQQGAALLEKLRAQSIPRSEERRVGKE